MNDVNAIIEKGKALRAETEKAFAAVAADAERQGRDVLRAAFPLNRAMTHGLLQGHMDLVPGAPYIIRAVWWEPEVMEMYVAAEREVPDGEEQGEEVTLSLYEVMDLWAENMLITVA